MNQGFAGLLSQVRQQNLTVDHMLNQKETVRDWIRRETERTKINSAINPLFPKEDFLRTAEDYVYEKMGKDMAQKAGAALSIGALHTADHLGGFYSTQSFQGDLFFHRLLKNLQPQTNCVPILAGGCVPLGSSTYARGLITYWETSEAQRHPIFPRRASTFMASFAPALGRDTIEKERLRILAKIGDKAVRREARYLFDDVYLRDDVLSQPSFAAQALFLGKGIMDKMPYITGGASFLHMELEDLFSRLIISDLDKKDSFLMELFSNTAFLKSMSELRDNEDRTLSTRLFRGCDWKRRNYVLRLCEDGFFRGRNQTGEETIFPARAADIKEALYEKQMLPGFYLCWFLTGLLRGFCFYGGLFQSLYLPNWHELTLTALKESGYEDLAGSAAGYDFSGYISGPLVMLYDTGDGATGAGPLEVMAVRPSEARFEELLSTDLKSAHEMGMFEFYNDLICGDDKTNDWYGIIARHLKEQYPGNLIQTQAGQ